MDSITLSALAGVLLSLGFSYIPGLSDWYAGRTPTEKRGIMALAIVVVAGATLGLSCAGILAGVTCDQAGAIGLIKAVVAALVANQATFLISKNGNGGTV
jgi:hypothetical protein